MKSIYKESLLFILIFILGYFISGFFALSEHLKYDESPTLHSFATNVWVYLFLSLYSILFAIVYSTRIFFVELDSMAGKISFVILSITFLLSIYMVYLSYNASINYTHAYREFHGEVIEFPFYKSFIISGANCILSLSILAISYYLNSKKK